MAWLSVDADGTETISIYEMFRRSSVDAWDVKDPIYLPEGSIEKLIGKKLSWEDEPVEIKALNS